MSDSTDADAKRRIKPDEKTLSPLSLLLLDQQERWQRGECPPAEAYLDKHPSLRDQVDHLLTLIYHEIVLRERRGERPTSIEYEQRFPQWAADIRQHFEIHAALSMASPFTQREPALGTPSSPPGYEILGVLGRGGSAIVYKARQLALGRIVALKMIVAGDHAGSDERARFRAEAQAIASLKHANIVQIYEVIEHDGRLFLALEFVDGGSLAKYVRGTPVSATVAVNLLEPLARAMHFVHQAGIVHRDLKPANVLLQIAGHRPHNDNGTPTASELQSAVPKVTDFGLAKWLQNEGQSPTRTGDVLGTPSYMAPEQIDGPRERVGPATDVYGLGAILYELLTGRPPFVGDTALVTLQQVRDEEPVSPTQLQRGCPRDLATIVLKCLQKLPGHRYADAAALADDLCRFRDGRAITARPVSNSEQLIKWARRRPTVAALVSLVAVLMLGGGALVTYLWLTTANALEDTKKARDGLGIALKDAQDANTEVEKSRAKIAKALDDTEKAHTKTAKALADAEGARQKTADTLAEKLLTLAKYEFSENKIEEVRKHLAAIPKSYRGKEWRHLDRQVNSERGRLLAEGRVSSILFSPDSKHLAFRARGDKEFVYVWDYAADRIVFKRELPDGAIDLFFDPANKSLGIMNLSGGQMTLEKRIAVQRFPLDGSAPGPEIMSKPGNHYPQLFPGPRYVVSTILGKAGQAELMIWNLDTGKINQREVKGLTTSALISLDGKHLAMISTPRLGADWKCQLIDLQKDTVEREFSGKHSGVMTFTPDFRSYVNSVHLGSVGRSSITLFDADTGVKKWEYNRPIGGIIPRYSFDSSRLGLASSDKRILVLDAKTGDEILVLRGHQGGVNMLSFSPDGRWLASADTINEIKIWAMDGSEK